MTGGPRTAARGKMVDVPHPEVPDMRFATAEAESEVATLVCELIRINTSNFGNHEAQGEGEAAEYCQARLAEVGIESQRFVTSASHREGVFARIAGTNPDRPALLLHGHLDVVPALEPGWLHPPFSGTIDQDAIIWGRGAVDMKNMDGMMLAVIRHWARHGVAPGRDIVLLFLPDEEAGGIHGSHWLVDHRPDIFEGVSEAVGEVGGFSSTIP
ncbi:MAG: M20/M25/M40 family metallo-hydrolase, partial [Actinomycetes bacterium]